MKSKFIILPAILAAVLLGGNCKPKETITITGSETMHVMLQMIGLEYSRRHSGIQVAVHGGGSIEGIEKLFQAKTDIAAASRPLTESEWKGLDSKGKFESLAVAYDGIAIVVHPSNKIQKIDLETASRVFSGEISDWSQLGGKSGKISVVIRNDKSGTASYFETHVLRQKDLGTKNYEARKNLDYSKDAKVVADNDSMAAAIETDPNSIGFMGMGSALYENKGRVRALEYSRSKTGSYVTPSIENVYNRKYELSRGLYLFYLSDHGQKIDDFVTFVTSEDGQKIILKSGYLRGSLPTVEVEAQK
ncbi:phosphate ABC transporter substrate-binding protein [Leptospira gomenensis]|uniref:Phosphate ABC transporter substrate-binding protein n=1 Tax=Leptospira gomenensis TaxID=2484974 RepID=A0A5F1YET4_9LEPT|nr:phosphate ABC transporter substrate-binding protein [Leptospira gomenensis]TGK32587.1 phosphate ABC transporter substrate-binding protein [Leptospira gomenensis]TGK38318.1 phosphate ABC transporter substrate-binding protein [Leptospira gomenensis]TGK52132.1 phosphate ABC transporter substrate-binding protein [Leptospira gomenensis]TGK59819.1 phosphate ABC transporter substrate-binding protein [Leptospira gomenensis]